MFLSAHRSPVLKTFCWVAIMLVAGPTLAQPTVGDASAVVSPGDVLSLSVPGHPEFELDLNVNNTGAVQIPNIGEIPVGGLTVTEATQVVRQRLRLFDPTINDISLSLGRAGGIQIHVIGSVEHPGAYSFASQPSLWDLLRAAGGAGENADLRAARIVRETRDGTDVQTVDLSQVLAGGTSPSTDLLDGDTLVVPTLEDGLISVPAANGVQVFGSVALPTVVPVTAPTPMMDVLMLAGAPTQDADLEEIWWIHRTGEREYLSTQINLKTFLEMGDPRGNPLIYPGDSLQVTYSEPSWLADNLPLILGMLATTATVFLAYDRIYGD